MNYSSRQIQAMIRDPMPTMGNEPPRRIPADSPLHSHAIGRGSYHEFYAFVWRDSAVEYVDGAVAYTNDRDTFARVAYSTRFRARGVKEPAGGGKRRRSHGAAPVASG
ncbi:hypothetical protein J2T57_002786 [Natronocella acetinitrilica]|uniref:Uncharacterized protein n=1 Tax=Natronocella acetinitrilica TaxID=414046 RepID=A0AAE3KCD4_9GAMM|nr:hypothetical protein [Natronocella acetinitrilica]MCP1675636.1 hypothetical protein [Natronocella acetinitrilica]